MKIRKGQLFRYRLPLLEAFPRQDSAQLWSDGFIVAFHSDEGAVAYGELTDVALTGDESFDVAQQQLKYLCDGHPGLDPGSRELALNPGSRIKSGMTDEIYAPVRWAISSALLGLELLHKGIDFASWMGRESSDAIVLNALLDASQFDFVDRGLQAAAQGFHTFKIKVGDGNLALEISRIRELVSVLGNGVFIRLDANQSMRLAEAVEMAKALKKVRVEYFEEPFKDLAHIEEFYRLTGIRVALDETVLTDQFELWRNHEAVCAYVLKPSRIGTISDLIKLMHRASLSMRDFVVTSTYESGIGLYYLAQIASVRQSKNVAMGLATGRYFADDFLKPPLRPFRGQFISRPSLIAMQQMNLAEMPNCHLLFEKGF